MYTEHLMRFYLSVIELLGIHIWKIAKQLSKDIFIAFSFVYYQAIKPVVGVPINLDKSFIYKKNFNCLFKSFW